MSRGGAWGPLPPLNPYWVRLDRTYTDMMRAARRVVEEGHDRALFVDAQNAYSEARRAYDARPTHKG